MTRPVVSDDDSDDCSDEEDDDDIESRGLSAASIVGTKGLKEMIVQLEKNVPSLADLTLSCKHLTEETAIEIASHLPMPTSST
jgi:hypothetical protein